MPSTFKPRTSHKLDRQQDFETNTKHYNSSHITVILTRLPKALSSATKWLKATEKESNIRYWLQTRSFS